MEEVEEEMAADGDYAGLRPIAYVRAIIDKMS
jgi:hypothetical protein